MSMVQLLKAVRSNLIADESLRTVIKGSDETPLTALDCEIRLEGRPTKHAGKTFLGIHGLSWNAGPATEHNILEEYFGLAVTISRRIGSIPEDRWGTTLYLDAAESLENLSRLVILSISKNRYTILTAANTAITDANENSYTFYRPMTFVNADPEPRVEIGDWYGLAMEETAALVMQVRFDGAERIQPLTSEAEQLALS